MLRIAGTIASELSAPCRRIASRGLQLLAFAALLAVGLPATAQQSVPPEPIEPAVPGDESLFSVDSPIGSIEYFTGRGLRLGRTGLTIGGFSTFEIEREEGGPGVFALDSINFLTLFEPIDALRGFAEIEVGDLFRVETDSDDVHSDPDVQIERLYGDYIHGDALSARFGKFQTPIGRWNLVPAEPFVWTTTQPLIVEFGFDEYTTGGALFGSLFPASGIVNYWLYGQALDPLDPQSDENPVDRSIGGRLEYGGRRGDWSVGASFQASEKNNAWSQLGGLDAFWQIGGLEFQSEFLISRGNIPDRDVWGIYTQGVYDLGELFAPLRRLYLVGRYEHFDPNESNRDTDLWDVGFTWMPRRFLILKAGYRFAERQTEDGPRGLTASISVVF